MSRRRDAWRVILALAVSAVLLLLAVGLRRDQVRAKAAKNDLRRVADVLDRWVHTQGALPKDLSDAVGGSIPNVNQRYQYADPERRRLAIKGEIPVALVIDRTPVRMTLRATGRPVLLCQWGANFQVKWFTETELVGQRQREANKMAVDRETSPIRAEP